MEGYELDTCPPDEFEDAFGGFGGDDLLLYRELLADGDGHDAMTYGDGGAADANLTFQLGDAEMAGDYLYSDLVIPALPSIIDPPAAPAPGGKRPRRAPAERRAGGGVRSTSKFRGVTHHCRTGRWEAHLWKDRKQTYLGGFADEASAALAYDLAAVRVRGYDAVTNYPMAQYASELSALNQISTEELVMSLRRQSKGIMRGTSRFRGVTKHAKGRWEARISALVGRKYRYLGLFDSEIEAAVAYDREAVRQKGASAVTNFDISTYASDIAACATGEASVGLPLLPSSLAMPGPAVAVEPSAEAVACISSFFARAPFLEPAAAEAAPASPYLPPPPAPAAQPAAKRPRPGKADLPAALGCVPPMPPSPIPRRLTF